MTASYSSQKDCHVEQKFCWNPKLPVCNAVDDLELDLELTVGTLNVWNSNPPSWLYPVAKRRRRRYRARLHHLQRQLAKLNPKPDVFTFQEVRFDSSLGLSDQAQLQRLSTVLPEFHYSYVPAQRYMNRFVDEEGVAIFSRYPISRTRIIRLGRDISDPDDVHSRAVLMVTVMVPSIDGNCALPVDVLTTHLSLSESARNAAVRRIAAELDEHPSPLQILTGDLNAEPHERAMRWLRGNNTVGFAMVDAWLVLHDEPLPACKDTWCRRNALTFPSDDPTKRIDYVLHRAHGSLNVSVDHVSVFGQAPTAETAFLDGRGHGMVSLRSPLYASDHRGVMATYCIRKAPSTALPKHEL